MIIHIFQLHQINGIQVKTKNGIIVIELLTKMRIDNEGAIVVAEV
jgi:hypothetical protein